MDDATDRIEQQLTTLFRRVQKIHVITSHGEFALDRSGYGLLCRIADEGPQRLGSFATAFGLDPSTITRQVQALERAGLAERQVDPDDRRAALLSLTEEGRRAVLETRSHRRGRLEHVLSSWPASDRVEFARLLAYFNESFDDAVGDEPAPEDA